MSRTARSARGDIINFDLLAIKQQLATAPIPVGVDDRRRFIDEKDGIRTKQTQEVVAQEPQVASALSMGADAAAESVAAAAKVVAKPKAKDTVEPAAE